MKTFCKVLAALAVLCGLLALAAALFAKERQPEYICLYGDPPEEA